MFLILIVMVKKKYQLNTMKYNYHFIKVILYLLLQILASNTYACSSGGTASVELLNEYPGIVASFNAQSYAEKHILHKRIGFFDSRIKSGIKIILPETPSPISKIGLDLSGIHIPKGTKLKHVVAIIEEELSVYDYNERHFKTLGHRLIGVFKSAKSLKVLNLNRINLQQEEVSIILLVGYIDLESGSTGYILENKRLPINRQGACPFGSFYTFTAKGLNHYKKLLKQDQ